MRIHKTVSADLAKVVAYLKASADKIASSRTEGRAEKKARLLADLSQKYTMHGERKTHNASIGAGADKPKHAVIYSAENQKKEPESLIAKASGGDDLGDNVELF